MSEEMTHPTFPVTIQIWARLQRPGEQTRVFMQVLAVEGQSGKVWYLACGDTKRSGWMDHMQWNHHPAPTLTEQEVLYSEEVPECVDQEVFKLKSARLAADHGSQVFQNHLQKHHPQDGQSL